MFVVSIVNCLDAARGRPLVIGKDRLASGLSPVYSLIFVDAAGMIPITAVAGKLSMCCSSGLLKQLPCDISRLCSGREIQLNSLRSVNKEA